MMFLLHSLIIYFTFLPSSGNLLEQWCHQRKFGHGLLNYDSIQLLGVILDSTLKTSITVYGKKITVYYLIFNTTSLAIKNIVNKMENTI